MQQTQAHSIVLQKAWKVIPFFRSSSIEATAAFYTETLSFILAGTHADPPELPTFASLFCGPKAAVNIYFITKLRENPAPPGRAMVALEAVADIDNLFGELQTKGIEVKDESQESEHGTWRNRMSEIEDTAWGYRQFELWDPDGNSLVFFAFIDTEEK